MNTRQIQPNITLLYPPEEKRAADIMEVACKRSLALNIKTWATAPQKPCRLFVMTSCFSFLFAAAPWYSQLLYAGAYLFNRKRLQKTWNYSGGWTMRYRWSTSIGVKPPRLIESSDKSIGMVTVDRYFARHTVRSDTIIHLGPNVQVEKPINHRQLMKMKSGAHRKRICTWILDDADVGGSPSKSTVEVVRTKGL